MLFKKSIVYNLHTKQRGVGIYKKHIFPTPLSSREKFIYTPREIMVL